MNACGEPSPSPAVWQRVAVVAIRQKVTDEERCRDLHLERDLAGLTDLPGNAAFLEINAEKI